MKADLAFRVSKANLAPTCPWKGSIKQARKIKGFTLPSLPTVTAGLVEVEVICSDGAAHRRRVEERVTDLPGFVQPTWAEVVDRDYQPREDDRLVIDTALTSPDAALAMLRAKLATP